MQYFINGNAVAIGSVITGTLKSEDLIPAFANEIKRLSLTRPKIVFEAECWIEGPQSYYLNILDAVVEPDGGTIRDCHESYASSIVHDLADHLFNMSPAGLFFGSHPGDGSDFGWWEDEE